MKKALATIALVLSVALIIPSIAPASHNVFQAEAASAIKLNKTKVSIVVGKTYTLKLKNAKASKVKWKTSKKSVATVTTKGKVKAKKVGKATITATYKKKKYTCKVTVKSNYKFVFTQSFPQQFKDPNWDQNISSGKYWTANVTSASGSAVKTDGNYCSKITIKASTATYNSLYSTNAKLLISVSDKSGELVETGIFFLPAPSASTSYAHYGDKALSPGTYYVELSPIGFNL